MDRDTAKKYLDRKGKDSSDESEVEDVMKRGKIYGDPLAMVE